MAKGHLPRRHRQHWPHQAGKAEGAGHAAGALHRHFTRQPKLQEGVVRQLNTKLVMWLANNNLAFIALDDQLFVDFMALACPSYSHTLRYENTLNTLLF